MAQQGPGVSCDLADLPVPHHARWGLGFHCTPAAMLHPPLTLRLSLIDSGMESTAQEQERAVQPVSRRPPAETS